MATCLRETDIHSWCQGFQKDCRFYSPLSIEMLCSRRRQRRTSLPTKERFYSQSNKSLGQRKREIDTYFLLKLGINIDPLSCLLNFLRCSVHGGHWQPSLIFSKNSQFFNRVNCNDYPPELVANTEIVSGTSTNARKVIRKYAAMTPASSYSYVAIVAWILLFRDPGGYPLLVRYSVDDESETRIR